MLNSKFCYNSFQCKLAYAYVNGVVHIKPHITDIL